MPPKAKVRKATTIDTRPAVVESPPDEPKAPKKKFADDDNSIDARMWRLNQDHIEMGARPAPSSANRG